MEPYLLIGGGGILGANTRYLVSTWAANRIGVGFPYGTLIVNGSGSFLIGLVLTILADRLHHNANATLLVATGYLGAYTTFSTFTYETIALVRRSAIGPAAVNVLASIAAGAIGTALGILLATGLSDRI